MQEKEVTDFGFKKVPVTEKKERVAGVFHSVAKKYDLMNDLMSFGIHRLWKRYAIALAGARRGHKVLDLAGGTGDLAGKFAGLVGEEGEVVLADINESMLSVGRDRLADKGLVSGIRFVLTDAENLPFPDDHFDCITIAFGLRNVTDKSAALASMLRVVKPGGRVLILEFSKPLSPSLSKVYDLYSFNVLPVMGQLVASDAESYRYLAESIRMHPDQDTLKNMMLKVGYDRVDVHNLTGGIVAIHRGWKA